MKIVSPKLTNYTLRILAITIGLVSTSTSIQAMESADAVQTVPQATIANRLPVELRQRIFDEYYTSEIEDLRQEYLTTGQHNYSALTHLELMRNRLNSTVLEQYRTQKIEYGFSIQELLTAGRIPAIIAGLLNLRNMHIKSLEGLQNIPDIQQAQDLRLNLNNNRITQIDAQAFQGTNLRSLYLLDNQITQIDAQAFQGLTNLSELNLFDNQITQIDAQAFQRLTNLTCLGLGNNQIRQIDAQAFQGLTGLLLLNLTSNRITQIDAQAFQGLTNLTYFFLTSNRITQIDAHAFQGLTNLRWLDLYGNRITQETRDQLCRALPNVDITFDN